MAVRYKQLCIRCKKNYVTMTSRQKYAVCYDCQKNDLNGEIKDPQMKKMFNIPEEWYKQNTFLGNIKINYLKFGKLTEKQVEAFKKVVDQIKKEKQ